MMVMQTSMSDDEDDDGNDDVHANSSKVLTMADRLNNKLNNKSSNLIFSKIRFQSIFQNQIILQSNQLISSLNVNAN